MASGIRRAGGVSVRELIWAGKYDLALARFVDRGRIDDALEALELISA